MTPWTVAHQATRTDHAPYTGIKELQYNQKTVNKTKVIVIVNPIVNPFLSISTLNVNGLKYLIKRYRVITWTKKPRSHCMLLTRNLL